MASLAEMVGNEQLDIFVVGVRAFIEDEKDLQIGGTIFEFGFKGKDKRVIDFTVFLNESHRRSIGVFDN